VAIYRSHEPNIRPYSDVLRVLERLKAKYKLAIISDGFLPVQKSKLNSLKLADYFDVVVFSDEWGRDAWKPSTQPFEKMLSALGVVANESVYVGDNPAKDFISAKKLGITTVRIRRAGGEHSRSEPPTPAHAPDVEITSLTELKKLLGFG